MICEQDLATQHCCFCAHTVIAARHRTRSVVFPAFDLHDCMRMAVFTREFAVSPIRSISPLTEATSLLWASSNSLNFKDELPAFKTSTFFDAIECDFRRKSRTYNSPSSPETSEGNTQPVPEVPPRCAMMQSPRIIHVMCMRAQHAVLLTEAHNTSRAGWPLIGYSPACFDHGLACRARRRFISTCPG